MRVVIVGGGPIGLYLAWKLAEKDVNSTVIDPYMGTYYRPGHLNSSVFRVIREDVPESFQTMWRRSRHIKDLERLLHEMDSSKKSKITLIKGTFIGFQKDPKGKHQVVYKTIEHETKIIPADTVFDCSGNKRAVLQATSEVIPELTWPVASKHDPVFPHHLLYYCHLDQDTEWFLSSVLMHEGEYSKLSGINHLTMVHELQKFGWYHGSFPILYTYPFNNKGKNALYCAAPSSLKPEQFHGWVTTIVRYKTGRDDCQVKFLPSLIAKKEKLRRMHFPMNYDRLQTVGREGDSQLPTIVAIGDAMIGFDYREAHGVKDGLTRIQQLLEYIEGYNGSLEFFDLDGYMAAIQKSLGTHEGVLVNSFNNDLRYCIEGHESLIREGSSLPQNSIFSTDFTQLVHNSSQALICLRSIEKVNQLSTDLKRNPWATDLFEKQLDELLLSITTAMANLPTEYQFPHRIGIESTTTLLSLLKENANKLFKQGKFSDAVRLYELGTHYAELLGNLEMAYPLYSNAVIAYKKLNDLDKVAKTCETCLDNLPIDSKYPIRGKVLFNLISSASENLDHVKLVETALKYKDDESVKFLSSKEQIKLGRIIKEIEMHVSPISLTL